MVFRVVSAQRKAEQQRNIRLAVTHALNEATTVPGMVRALSCAPYAKASGGIAGCFLDRGRQRPAARLQGMLASHRRPDVRSLASISRNLSRVFSTTARDFTGPRMGAGQPAWIGDLWTETRASCARQRPAQHGLQCAFACPVVVGDRVLGVMEFFTQPHARGRLRPARDDEQRRRQRRPVHRAQDRRGRAAPKRSGALRLLRERHGRSALGRTGRQDLRANRAELRDARLQPRRVRRSVRSPTFMRTRTSSATFSTGWATAKS